MCCNRLPVGLDRVVAVYHHFHKIFGYIMTIRLVGVKALGMCLKNLGVGIRTQIYISGVGLVLKVEDLNHAATQAN
jgi:hypothetical protein